MKKQEVKYYRDCYLGSLDENTADSILYIREQKCINGLKNCIYDLDDDVIEEIKEFGPKYLQQPEIEDGFIKIGSLKDNQTVACALLHIAKRMLITDAVGLGKTVEVAAMVNVCNLERSANGQRPLRYIFLSESTDQICKKLIKFTGEYVHESTGEIGSIQKWIELCRYGVWCSLVATHSILDSTVFFQWLYLNRSSFDLFVLDESWVVKTRTSNKYKVTDKITDWFERVVFLNATPFELNIEDMYNQLRLVDKKLLPSIGDFEKEYTNTLYSGGIRKRRTYKNEDLFNQRVRLRVYGNTRKDLNSKYEDNDGSVIFVDLSKEQKYLMRKTTLWRMVCDCPIYLDRDLDVSEEVIPKLGVLRELLSTEVAEGDTVYMYCYYKEAQYMLKEYIECTLGYTCEIINSDVRKNVRDVIIDNFNNKKFKVLIANVSRQLDLKTCNYLILYSFDFNPAKIQQVEGRITREFDVIGKTIRLLCTTGKEEKYLMSKIAQRAKNASKYSKSEDSIILNILLEALERRKQGCKDV